MSSNGRGSSLIIDRRNNEITSSGECYLMVMPYGLLRCRSKYCFGWFAFLLDFIDTLNPPTRYDKAVLGYGIFGIISLLQSDSAVLNVSV